MFRSLSALITNRQKQNLAIVMGYALLIIYLLFMSWRRWHEPWNDFGLSLYHSWLIAEGSVLGRDMIYHYGPLAVHINALLVKIFGNRLEVFYTWNLLLVIADILLIYHLFARHSKLLAHLCCISFITCFGIVDLMWYANHNHIAPYKPECAYGTFLTLLAMNVFYNLTGKPTAKGTAVFGFLIGALILTGTEHALVAIALVCLYIYTFFDRIRSATIVAPLAGVLAPCLFFTVLLGTQWNWRDGLITTFRSVMIMGQKNLISSDYFALVSGLDRPIANLMNMNLALIALLVLTGLFACMHALLVRRNWPLWCSYLAAAGIGMIISLTGKAVFLNLLPRLFLPAAVCAGLLQLFVLPRGHLLGLLSVVSIALLGRIILDVRISYLGFYLAIVPMLTMVALLWEGHHYNGWPHKHIQTGILLALVFACTGTIFQAQRLSHEFWEKKNYLIRAGDSYFHDFHEDLSDRGPAYRELLADLEKIRQPGDTLMGSPQAHIINFTMKFRQPTRHSFSMGELMLFGVDGFFARLSESPADYFLLINKLEHFERPLVHYKDAMQNFLTEHFDLIKGYGAQNDKLLLFRRKGYMSETPVSQ